MIIPGNKISPKPNKEHFNKGVFYGFIKDGHMNFIGKSILVATVAITDSPNM